MPRRLIDIIPLDALRVFEACARLMSFTAAANEMSVTQAAVSRRIKNLEALLNVQLFRRHGKRLSMTPGGKRLYKRVQTALEYLASEIEDISQDHGENLETISISAGYSISQLWLAKKLKAFACDHPDINIRFNTSEGIANLSSSKNEVVLMYAPEESQDWNTFFLHAEKLIPMASPSYFEDLGVTKAFKQLSPSDLVQFDFFDYRKSTVNAVTFREWYRNTVGTDLPVRPKFIFSTYPMAVDSAVRGEGIILGCKEMLVDFLKDGRLVELGTDVLETGFSYYVCIPCDTVVEDHIEMLVDYLLTQKAS